MNLFIRTNLVKYIYDNFSQIDIMSYYTDIDVEAIKYCIKNPSAKVHSKERVDTHASVGFMYFKCKEGVKLRLKDHGDSTFSGDIFDAAGRYYQLNPRIKKEFFAIGSKMIEQFTNHTTTHTLESEYENYIYDESIEEYEVMYRKWKPVDIEYFSKRGIYAEELKNDFVGCADYIYHNNKCIYTYRPNDPCYVYLEGSIEDINIYEFYFPYRKRKNEVEQANVKFYSKTKFFTNNKSRLLGTSSITGGDILIITKAKKELMAVKALKRHMLLTYRVGEQLSIDTVRFSNEAVKLTPNEANVLTSNHKLVFTFTDYDKQGIICAKFHKEQYGFIPIFLTNGILGTINFGAKDLTDFTYKYGINETIALATAFLDRITPLTNAD